MSEENKNLAVFVETGIYIRAQIDGEWGNVDIADPRLYIGDLFGWLEQQGKPNYVAGKGNFFFHKLVASLLGRREEMDKLLKQR